MDILDEVGVDGDLTQAFEVFHECLSDGCSGDIVCSGSRQCADYFQASV